MRTRPKVASLRAEWAWGAVASITVSTGVLIAAWYRSHPFALIFVLMLAALAACWTAIASRNYARETARASSFESLLQHSSDVVAVLDDDLSVTYVSPAAERVFGGGEDAIGQSFFSVLSTTDAGMLRGCFEKAREVNGDPVAVQWSLKHQDGRNVDVESIITYVSNERSIHGYVMNSRDISDMTALESQLSHRAFHDGLTELPNRALFKDRLDQAVHRWHRSGELFAVLFCDLDSFKAVNDSIGHSMGDRLLVEVARRLKGCTRAGDTVSRFGGDEFAVLLETVTEDEITAIAGRITASIERSFVLDRREVFIGTSVGVVTGSGDPAESSADILRNADLAMYVAKSLGKNRAVRFEPSMQHNFLHQLELKNDLRPALDDEQFVVYYQPILELATNKLASVEALVRWNHPTRGLVGPVEFIPLCEETGMIIQLGEWVMEQACTQLRIWQEYFPEAAPRSVSVNLSGRQLQEQDVVTKVSEVLRRSRLAPSSLTLEVTESVLLTDVDAGRAQLEHLHDLGIRIAIDDFGTGYSSLNYLQQFPIDVLKIDRSFVSGIGTPGNDSVLAHAIMTISQMLNLKTVAEGIEEPGEVVELQRMGCDMGQGYFFARPMPAEELTRMLTESLVGQPVID